MDLFSAQAIIVVWLIINRLVSTEGRQKVCHLPLHFYEGNKRRATFLHFPVCIPVNRALQPAQDSMTSCLRSLVLSAVLCAQLSHLCCPLYASELTLVKNAVLSESEKSEERDDSLADEPPFFYLAPEVLSAMESRQKRMFIKDKYRIQTQRGKLYQNRAKTDRWSKFTLSLDVPTHLMNVLFDIAKTQHLQAKAEDNARLLALIGKRK